MTDISQENYNLLLDELRNATRAEFSNARRMRAAIAEALSASNDLYSDKPMACCGLKPSEGHNGCCTFYGEDIRAIMAACSRAPHHDAPGAARAAHNIIREIERVVAHARDRAAMVDR